ncbi:MAG: hypothetical protein RL226_819 [Bacteroidota bacterium]
MKKILFSLSILATTWANAQIQVDYITPNEAVQQLLGQGVEATNIQFTGSSVQLGLLYGGQGTIFSLDSGIVLSCGDVTNLENDMGADVPFGEGVSGDPDLLSIANSVPPLIGEGFTVGAVNDLAVLEFDFTVSGDSLSFSYSFGSDEYLEWVNSTYNDIFAFFLSGPGITGPYDSPAGFPGGAVNIAEVPNSVPQLPITVSSVNDILNSEYYVDNVNNFQIAIDGFTVKITANYEVICGETYHIKLAVADGTDTALESIVVIEAGSFATNDLTVSSTINNPPPTLPPFSLLEGCVDGSITIFKPAGSAQDTAFLQLSGSAIPGEDFDPLPAFVVFPDGVSAIEIPVSSIFDGISEPLEDLVISYQYTNACGDTALATASLNIVNYDLPTLDLPTEIFLCNGESQIVSGIPTGGYPPFAYTWSNGATSSTISATSTGPEQYSVSVIDYCQNTVADEFIISIPEPIMFSDDYELCTGISFSGLVAGGSTPYSYSYEVFQENDTLYGSDLPNFPEAGLWVIDITDACGETGTVEVDVQVCETAFPNVFTPNNDEHNDYFIIRVLEGFPRSRLEVYNRWGGLVYESDNYQNAWQADGLPDGSYYYILYRADGKKFSGDFMIMRN